MRFRVVPVLLAVGALLTACSADPATPAPAEPPSEPAASVDVTPSPEPPPQRLQAGNPDGRAAVPPEARAEDTSRPTT